jgi:hypothetical protein
MDARANQVRAGVAGALVAGCAIGLGLAFTGAFHVLRRSRNPTPLERT